MRFNFIERSANKWGKGGRPLVSYRAAKGPNRRTHVCAYINMNLLI